MRKIFTLLLGLSFSLLVLLGSTTTNATPLSPYQGNNSFELIAQQTTPAIEKVYPTNSSTEINIAIGSVPEGASLQVFNLIGKKIADYPIKTNQTLTINVSNLPKGIYFVRVGNFQQVERFIVHR